MWGKTSASSSGPAAGELSSMWNRMKPSGSGGAAIDAPPSARSIPQVQAPKQPDGFVDAWHDVAQPGLTREDSSGFHFQYNFSRDNPGSLQHNYEVNKRSLGEGSFGSARIAKCKDTGLMRAVKTIRIKAVKDPKRLELEIRIAKQLDHPNVVRLFETFHEEDKLHLVMELCTGGELFDRIVNEGARGFSEATAAKYVQQMTASICYLHAHNVAHRDVKPENFLFQSKARDAKLKCIDFGLAKIFEPGKTMSTRVGTAYYVAPEVLQGCYDARCDVWSVGVIAYLLLCGYAPFSGNDDTEILRRVRRGTFKFNSPEWDAVSEEAKGTIKSMMLFDYSTRPTASQILDVPWVKGTDAHRKSGSHAKTLNVVERLEQFRQHTRMKRVALTAVAQQLPESETERLGELFRSMDRDGDGELSAEEVRHGLEAQGLQAPEALEELLRTVDCNGSGRVDYTEFVAAMMDEHLLCKRDLCRAAFRAFDLDGDGVITPTELTKVLSSTEVGGTGSFGLSRARIDNIIKEVDHNGDGTIDFEEFCEMLSPSKNGARKTRTAPAIQAASWAQSRSPGGIRGASSERGPLQRDSPGASPVVKEAPRPAAGAAAPSGAPASAGADDEKKKGWRTSAGSRMMSIISLARGNTKGLAGRK